MEAHEYANIFPMMNEAEFDELCRDMAEHGYRPENPIITYQGKILDGRNRFKATEQVGVLPMFVEFGGDDPLNFVLSQNLHRRHLNSSQRAIAALEVERIYGERAKEKQGQRTDILEIIPKSEPVHAAKEAAKITGNNFIGFELDQTSAETARERILNAERGYKVKQCPLFQNNN